MRSMDAPYLAHLRKDKYLAKILVNQSPLMIRRKKNICLRLCASIMSQQLSTKVAEVIFKRFLLLFDTTDPRPEQVLALDYQQLRSIGLSHAKATYVHNVAEFAIAKGMTVKKLNTMDNETVIQYLTEIKGVGRWTVEMLLMFTLGREDVFAVDDLGIQQSMARVYKLEHLSNKELKEKMMKISGKWIPYRTYACMHLWNYKDTPA
jgi:DNA-3-methyladenine glycosylase II